MNSTLLIWLGVFLIDLISSSHGYRHMTEDDDESSSNERDLRSHSRYMERHNFAKLIRRLSIGTRTLNKKLCLEALIDQYYRPDDSTSCINLNQNNQQGSVVECMRYCDSLPDCLVWAYDGRSGRCYPMSTKGQRVNMVGITSGACDDTQTFPKYKGCNRGRQCWRGCSLPTINGINGPNWCYTNDTRNPCNNDADCWGGAPCSSPCYGDSITEYGCSNGRCWRGCGIGNSGDYSTNWCYTSSENPNTRCRGREECASGQCAEPCRDGSRPENRKPQ